MIKLAKLSQLKAGDVVRTYGLSCVDNVNSTQVCQGELGLYIDCDHGQHYLDGQILPDGDTLIGIEKV